MEFKGHKVHSAEWDHSYDYSGKRIGIIGNGSSGIQILPKLAQLEGTEIVSFQRGPTWITPSLGEALGANPADGKQSKDDSLGSNDTTDDSSATSFNPKYDSTDKENFHDKKTHTEYRKMLQQGMNKGFKLVRYTNPEN